MTNPLFRRILVPVDFSEGADRAFEYAIRMTKAFDAELHLLHIFDRRLVEDVFNIHNLDRDQAREQLAERAKEGFARLLGHADEAGVTAETHCCEGIPAREIIRMVNDLRSDLLVIGSHGTTALRDILFGTTAEAVVRNAPCPVLSIGDGPSESAE